MNLYFLVEGETEMEVYPKWLAFLFPWISRVDTAAEAINDNYFLIGSRGFPRILDVMLPRAIEEINDLKNFSRLVLCFDSDEVTMDYAIGLVDIEIRKQKLVLNGYCKLDVIVYNRCMETWFLGNRPIFPKVPIDRDLIEFVRYFNVHNDDPEQMGNFKDTLTHSQFHQRYLKRMLAERRIAYRKSDPGIISERAYFDALVNRIQSEEGHLNSFQQFKLLCDEINQNRRYNQ